MMTKTEALRIKELISSTLNPVLGDKYRIEFGNVSYSSTDVRFPKFRIVEVGSHDESAASLAKAKFSLAARFLDVNPDAYDKEFVVQGRRFIMKELKISRPKNPVLAQEVETGKMFKMALTDNIKSQLAY